MDALYPATAPAVAGAGGSYAALSQRLLNFVLFVTILLSSVAFIEPSPHDAMMPALLIACIAARVRFDRKLTPLLVLVLVWIFCGFLSLIQVGDEEKAIQYIGTSLYLAIAALMYACLFSDGNLLRLALLRRAYILAALIATAAGYIGYFHLLPGANIFLDITPNAATFSARVSATFKDPNVYGPFLIFPLLILVIRFLTGRIGALSLVMMAALLGGLFLSFSRGAWMHFILSAAVAVSLTFASAQNRRMRSRMILLGLAAAVAIALLIIAMMSIGSIHDMFVERAKVLQPYDTGPGGRFTLQQLALNVILDHPNGLGPFEFARIFGVQQHNVYMEAFLVFGWIGGATYLTIVALTLVVGFRAAMTPAPWQYYLIAAYGAFFGDAGEGIIVDTDHWRHFFLMMGIIWGLAIANINSSQRLAWRHQDDDDTEMIPVVP